MSRNDKWIRTFSVDETAKHENRFTIYKITSVLFPIESPEAVTVVSVWKRYTEVQRLHKDMQSLHSGLHLRGIFPTLPKYSYFKRFQQEVIQERAKTIKQLLEFIAEHNLLFTSTAFVNFLQTGHPEPKTSNDNSGVINTIRSSLHLPIEELPPLEYQTSDEDSRSPQHTANFQTEHLAQTRTITTAEIDNISQIPIYEAADVECSESTTTRPMSGTLTKQGSFESMDSLESIKSDIYEDITKIAINKDKPLVRSKSVLPDLINFDIPSSSRFDDYHTMPKLTGNTDLETVSLNSTMYDSTASIHEESRASKMSTYSRGSMLSLSHLESKTRTEDSYIFEAGYMLNMGARCEQNGDYQKAFDYYKNGIEKMLIGVQADPDSQRRAIIKDKSNKYLAHAEDLYKNHLCDAERTLILDQEEALSRALHSPLPISMLRRPQSELAQYRVLAVRSPNIMSVMRRGDQARYAIKVLQKVPYNLIEFDEYYLQQTQETRMPILPTNVPYMVPLISFIETNNLIFLILKYAPGQRLMDFINNKAKSTPNTPAREVNLENVFVDPVQCKNIDIINDNTKEIDDDEQRNNNDSSIKERSEDVDKSDGSISLLVKNSQKLLSKVDKVLKDSIGKDIELEKDVIDKAKKRDSDSDIRFNTIEIRDTSLVINELGVVNPRRVVPPSSCVTWGAEILTALESLHNSGVVCRDLNPANILLGNNGQVILTYMYSYPGVDMCLAKVRANPRSMYIAPELIHHVALISELGAGDSPACDFWSFGAIMYELLCGVPLSRYHSPAGWCRPWLLQLPPGLTLEEESLLTQLLTEDPSERLGSGEGGIEQVKRHPYFRSVDWRLLYDSWAAPD